MDFEKVKIAFFDELRQIGLEKTALLGVGIAVPFGAESKDPEAAWEHAVNLGIPHGVAYVRRHKDSGLGGGIGLTGPHLSIGIGGRRKERPEEKSAALDPEAGKRALHAALQEAGPALGAIAGTAGAAALKKSELGGAALGYGLGSIPSLLLSKGHE